MKVKASFLPRGALFVLLSMFIMTSCKTTPGDSYEGIAKPVAGDVAAQFADPPAEYSMTFYWGWDGDVTEEVIARDLDEFSAHNVQVVSLEPGYEMGSSYLSPGWFEKVETAVRLVKERDMRIYLIDEGKYPSGFAGGKITSDAPELRMKALVQVDTTIELSGGESILMTLGDDVVSAAAYNRSSGSAEVLEIMDGKLNWTAPEGDWDVVMVQHAFRSSPTRSVNNPTRAKDPSHSLIDYLDAAATEKFIEFTHEQYKSYVGEEFRTTVLGFRGDEPDYSIRGIPWTPGLFDEFEARKGYDVRPYVSTFFSREMSDIQRRVKADYWDVMSKLFADNFFKVQADWCAENNVDYLVHLNHEENMVGLIRSEGDFFRDMQTVQMPGVDAIWHQIWPGEVNPVFPKYASSVAHVTGRPRSFTESFAAYRPQPDLPQAKWILDQQLVRGINMVEVMFVSASSRGESGMRGWLADDRFADVAKYIHRSCYLLSQGVPAANLAVLFSVSSLWLGDNEYNDNALEVMQGLLEAQHDFDVIDEQALDSLMQLDEVRFVNRSGQWYSTIVIPPVSAISSRVIDRLKAFEQSGGQVIWLGDDSVLSVGQTFRDAEEADVQWKIQEPSGELTPTVLEALRSSDFILDKPCKEIKYTHRSWDGADLYFVFNEGDARQELNVTLSGKGKVFEWNAMDGEITEIPGAKVDGESVSTAFTLEPWETIFIVVGKMQEGING